MRRRWLFLIIPCILCVFGGSYLFISQPKCNTVKLLSGALPETEALGNEILTKIDVLDIKARHLINQCGHNITVGLLLFGDVPDLSFDTEGNFRNIEVIGAENNVSPVDRTDSQRISFNNNIQTIDIVRLVAPNAKIKVFAVRGIYEEDYTSSFKEGAKVLKDKLVTIILNGITLPLFNTPTNRSELEALVHEYNSVLWLHAAGLYGNSYVSGVGSSNGPEPTYTAKADTTISNSGPLFHIILTTEAGVIDEETYPQSSATLDGYLVNLQSQGGSVECSVPLDREYFLLYAATMIPNCSPQDTSFLAGETEFTLTLIPLTTISYEIFGQNVIFNSPSLSMSIPSPNDTNALHSLSVGVITSKTLLHTSYDAAGNNPDLVFDKLPISSLNALAYAGGVAALYAEQTGYVENIDVDYPERLAFIANLSAQLKKSTSSTDQLFVVGLPPLRPLENLVGPGLFVLALSFMWVANSRGFGKVSRFAGASGFSIILIVFIYSRLSPQQVIDMQALIVSIFTYLTVLVILSLVGVPIDWIEAINKLFGVHIKKQEGQPIEQSSQNSIANNRTEGDELNS